MEMCIAHFEDNVREVVAQIQTEIFVTDYLSGARIVYFTPRDVIKDLWQKFRVSMKDIKEYDKERLMYDRNTHPVSITSELLNRMGVDHIYLPKHPPTKNKGLSTLFYRINKRQ